VGICQSIRHWLEVIGLGYVSGEGVWCLRISVGVPAATAILGVLHCYYSREKHVRCSVVGMFIALFDGARQKPKLSDPSHLIILILSISRGLRFGSA
jgi:hypothetical protein